MKKSKKRLDYVNWKGIIFSILYASFIGFIGLRLYDNNPQHVAEIIVYSSLLIAGFGLVAYQSNHQLSRWFMDLRTMILLAIVSFILSLIYLNIEIMSPFDHSLFMATIYCFLISMGVFIGVIFLHKPKKGMKRHIL